MHITPYRQQSLHTPVQEVILQRLAYEYTRSVRYWHANGTVWNTLLWSDRVTYGLLRASLGVEKAGTFIIIGAIHLVRTHKFPDFRPPTPPVRTYYDVTIETIHWRTQSA